MVTLSAGVYWVLLPHVGISLLSWLQIILSMNRLRDGGFTRLHAWSLLLLLQGGLVRWVASIALRTASLAFQLATAFVGTCLSWVAFVFIFNEDALLPTRQQWAALAMSMALTALWEVNNRIVFDLV